MKPKIQGIARIAKPTTEVFDAVVNPSKLSGYFTTLGGANMPLWTCFGKLERRFSFMRSFARTEPGSDIRVKNDGGWDCRSRQYVGQWLFLHRALSGIPSSRSALISTS